jgi:hypothetical protein
MMGADGSFGKWKEFVARGEMDIFGARYFPLSAWDACVFG